jgi:hypothetical protein
MWLLIACTCATPAVQVFPSPAEKAPLNTRIHLILPDAAEGLVFELKPPAQATTKKDKKKKKARPEPAVELDRIEAKSGALWFVELAPREPLAPETRYELWMTAPGGRPAVIGEIATGVESDTTPPAWSGVGKPTWVKAPASPGTCQTGKPHALFGHQPAADAVLYAVWLADAAGKIDYAKPPTTWLRDWNGKLALGNPSICSPSNADLPASGKLRVGLKALDHAGNLSAPSEATLLRR